MFYFVFHKVFVPRANRLVPPAPYRDYGKERTKLLVRILRRIEATCALNKKDVPTTVHNFIAEWFHVSKNAHHDLKDDDEKSSDRMTNFPELSPTPSSSPENSDDDMDSMYLHSPMSVASSQVGPVGSAASSCEPSICLYKEDIDDFFAWAFFGKHHLTMLPWEVQELSTMMKLLQQQHNITFPHKPRCPQKRKSQSYHNTAPRCMTLEPVNAIHRPLLVYIIVAVMKIGAGIILRCLGYRRIVAKTGLICWHKPAGGCASGKQSSSSFLPLLFFHGIAPSGLVLYLPMILFGIATEPERPIFLFENPSISCTIDFAPLTEEQTVQGIEEIMNHCLSADRPISVMGHSFGSCPIAWLLKSELSHRIHQIALLDPVAIMLSEPDVMVNFLYAQEINKIRMVASSELFTEYYLRRHFAWYNSELWLQDLQEHQNLLVCLSEQDEILNAKKVQQELKRHASETTHTKPTTVYWNNVGHGACISSPPKWKQIKGFMLKQELEISQRPN